MRVIKRWPVLWGTENVLPHDTVLNMDVSKPGPLAPESGFLKCVEYDTHICGIFHGIDNIQLKI